MREISWISFDHTVPVPVLSAGSLISRDDIPLLLTAEFNLFKWGKDGVRVQWRDGEDTVWNDDDCDLLERVEVEGVEFFRLATAPFEFNGDTEQMTDLGYSAHFVPGGGIVVNTPATSPEDATDRIVDDIESVIGRYIPEHLNSWDEYASQVPNLDRAFALAGVERHEKEKQALVASRVGGWLADRAQHTDPTNTARADELTVGDVLDAVDVRWWSHTPYRVTYEVTAIESAEDGKLTIVFASDSARDAILTVPADRRFLKAT
ncbi:MAG TPA: hypothetical protein VF867_16080 [Arthrobacter sp.]